MTTTTRAAAGSLREVPEAQASRRIRTRPTLAITSGKGGVGKTTVVANLAVALRGIGNRVTVVDGAIGMGDVDSFFGLDAELTLEDVLRGDAKVDEVLRRDAHGVHILPAATGVVGLASLSHEQLDRLWQALDNLPACDELLVDTATGISDSVLTWLDSAKEIVLVTTPDPVAWVDAYALLKLTAALDQGGRKRIRLLVNQVGGPREAAGVFTRLREASTRFLKSPLELLGHVVHDPLLMEAARCRQPLISLDPEAPASRCFREIANRLRSQPQSSRNHTAALSLAEVAD